MLTDANSQDGKEVPAPEKRRNLANKTMSTFVIPPNEKELFSRLDEVITGASKSFVEIGVALRANIAGLIATVSVPYTLAAKSAADRHWQGIHTAARIRSLKSDAELGLDREVNALSHARSAMARFVDSPEGHEALIEGTLNFLDTLQSYEAVIRAADELIRQGVVLCWSAFEVAARDCFVAYLNAKPAQTLTLLGDPVAKRRFELGKFSVETLATHNFNLSERMGSLLAQQQDLSDVFSVKSVYQALFPADVRLSESLDDSNLRLLSLRRNLIVHQCGVIDETYLTASKSGQQVGERLKLSPDNLEEHVGTVIKVATNIIDAVATAV